MIVATGFERVAEAFDANLKAEAGAACAIRIGGEPVIDLWGGYADVAEGTPWRAETLVPVYSVTKGIFAVAVAQLAEEGLLDPDAPLANYWPEFAARGKGSVTVRQALAHRAGVPFIDGDVTLEDLADPREMAARLAAQPPLFAPGSAHIYHPITAGWIVGELVHRVTGASIGDWLRDRVATPLRLALRLGLSGVSKGHVAALSLRDPATRRTLIDAAPVGTDAWRATTLNGLVSLVPGGPGVDLNDPRLQAIGLAGAGLLADARSLAAFYAACLKRIEGVRLLSERTVSEIVRPVSFGTPFSANGPGPSWGAGVMIAGSNQPMLGGSSFGHDGFGGSLAFASPEREVAFAYVRNGFPLGGVRDEAVYRVVDALAASLDRRRWRGRRAR